MSTVRTACVALTVLGVAGCGQAQNESGSPTGTLCFDYFQRCVYPLALDTPLAVDVDNDGVFESSRSCSNAGCHLDPGISGGGLRLRAGSATIAAGTAPAQVRGTDMHINFLSAKGRADLVDPRQSSVLKKPLMELSHGGGRVFVTDQDSAAQQLLFWIQNRVPAGGDEFASVCQLLFDGGVTGACRTLP